MPNNLGYTALSSRVRLARNVEGLAFPHKLTNEQAEAFYKRVLPLFTSGYEVFFMAELSAMEKAVLSERQIISTRLAERKTGAVATKGNLSVMMLEEDAFRICAIERGFHLTEAYAVAAEAERTLASKLPFAKMPEFGYLTASFLNVGAGIRASTTVLLPAITKAGKLKSALAVLDEEGIAVRGVLGEGSASEHALYQISNAHSYGRTDAEVLLGVKQATLDLANLELATRKDALNENPKGERERFLSAVHSLSKSGSLSYSKAMQYLTTVMEGVSVGVLTDGGVDLYELGLSLRPASLALKRGKILSQAEENEFRMAVIKENLEGYQSQN